MLSKTYTYGIIGLEAYAMTIEVDSHRGLPCTHIVGLPDNAVKESKQRVRSAIKNSGYKYPGGRIIVNLSPADIKKEGPSFDLAIAVGILAASGQIPEDRLEQFVLLGELSLDGHLQPVKGSLSVALSLERSSLKKIIVPSASANEAALSKAVEVFPAKSLSEALHILTAQEIPAALDHESDWPMQKQSYDIDFADVKGQSLCKRGLEVAAAGGHNVLLLGPPGSGKSMLAKRMPTILPDMNEQESLEVTKVHSCMGYLKAANGLTNHRPFRSPHHTTSDVALVGGGSVPKPGEVTLSHNGVLFLDEIPEFNRNCLEALRQPLEDLNVTISRASKSLKFPADFMLIAAMNPCPCGWYTEPKKECHCSMQQIRRYVSKISGPLLDRIDIHLEVPTLSSIHLLQSQPSESSCLIKQRTTAARKIQLDRANTINARLSQKQIKQFCALDGECENLLKQTFEQLNFSARAYDKILRVARTIADIDEDESIQSRHIAEAVQYRSLDRHW